MQVCGSASSVCSFACIAPCVVLPMLLNLQCICVQEVLDLQLAVQMRDDHLAECQRQSELDQLQIDDLERQLLMQVVHTLKIYGLLAMHA